MEKITIQELQGVAQLDDSWRGDQWFGRSDTIIDQRVKEQSAKPPMEISEISTGAFGQFKWGGAMTAILEWYEVDNEIQLEAIKISKDDGVTIISSPGILSGGILIVC